MLPVWQHDAHVENCGFKIPRGVTCGVFVAVKIALRRLRSFLLQTRIHTVPHATRQFPSRGKGKLRAAGIQGPQPAAGTRLCSPLGPSSPSPASGSGAGFLIFRPFSETQIVRQVKTRPPGSPKLYWNGAPKSAPFRTCKGQLRGSSNGLGAFGSGGREAGPQGSALRRTAA